MGDNNQKSSAKLPPDEYRELVQKVADRIWKLMQAEQRISSERYPTDGRRRKRS